MCGIWAVFGSDGDVSVQCHAVHAIGHRGPDAFRVENIQHLQNCCLGFHRLAIVDDVRGMQPMRLYTHPHVWLVYNGEIYNHKLLEKSHELQVSTNCDGEPMIHLYNTLGPEAMAAQLDGVFAFCILDTAQRKVILGRDTFGVRPLFTLHTQSGFLAVCSEAKGLFGLSHSLRDEDAIMEAFPPGHVAVYDLDKQGRAVLSRTTPFHRAGQAPLYKTLVSPDADDIKKNIRTLFEAAVRKRLMAERRIGCLLSGGLDSSLVAALLVKMSKEMGLTYPIQTFAIGMDSSPDLKAGDALGMGLCVAFIALVRLPSLKVSTMLLVGLLIYDVFWVFFSSYIFSTNVMVKVATRPAENPVGIFAKKLHLTGLVRDAPKLSLPAKLVFPSSQSAGNFNMLGLGDIVMPGLLLCFVLRYDTYKKSQLTSAEAGVPPPPNYVQRVSYFHCSLIGYFLGLLTATVSSEVFRAAQPALLYLVPFTLLPLLTMAYLKGDLRRMWHEPFIQNPPAKHVDV